jgi:hypothetical protein
MLVERLRDGSHVFAGRFDEFLREWRSSPQSSHVILPDKRPAVRREPDVMSERASYVTVHPHVWEYVRPRLKMLMATRAHPKRSRLCQACGAEMKVVQEMSDTWSFACEICKSVEIHGKNLIGGVIGAGEVEKK